MGCDRFVYFEKAPSSGDVGAVLRDFFKGIATKVYFDGNRWFVDLPGTNSFAFASFEPLRASVFDGDKRWIEVFVASDNVDVITRCQDEVTNALAEGFVRCIQRYWHGESEDEWVIRKKTVPHVPCATYTDFKLKFGLFTEPHVAIQLWIKDHDQERHIQPGQKRRYSGAVGGAYTFEFTPTGLGTVVRCRCACGESVDVSDYNEW